MSAANEIVQQIDDLLVRVEYAREIGILAKVKKEMFDLYDEVEQEVSKLKAHVRTKKVTLSHGVLFLRYFSRLNSGFSTSYGPGSRQPITLQGQEKPIFKNQQEQKENEIRDGLRIFKTQADFWSKLDFFTRDVVVVGSNGSGKTFLADHLGAYVNNADGIVISAQRVLAFPVFESIKSYDGTLEQLSTLQARNRFERSENGNRLVEEFKILVEHLLADDAKALRQNRKNAKEERLPAPTKLQTLLMVWNSLFSHLEISLPDDINIEAIKSGKSFRATTMSEGEKVALFLMAKVLLCPENGLIVVDEPEMYLHPTIYKKLWDRLENERRDCKFIYLTHNLDFAASRTSAKKLWLRSFTFPIEFIFEEIPNNEIPEPLLLELLGSRQSILFCEGEPSGLDETIYGILFSKYIIKPVRGCRNVINYTKAFNKLDNVHVAAIGIIDSDFHDPDGLVKLEKEKIFNIRLPEIENLLFEEMVLTAVCESLGCADKVTRIKELVLERLVKEKDLQISNQVSARVNSYFKNSNVPNGTDIHSLKNNFNKFLTNINFEEWAEEQNERINKIISEQDYGGAIRIL